MYYKKSIPHIIYILLILLLSLAHTPQPVHADNIIVITTTSDNADSDGLCSLREAIVNANKDSSNHNDCNAGSGNDSIIFDDVIGEATLTLTSTLPEITDPGGLTINGGGDITVNGDNLYGVFSVSEGAQLTLHNLTVVNGNLPGANGAGAVNFGSLLITNSTFSNNSANSGGGVTNGATGTLSIVNSTFSNNIATNIGGGVFNGGGTLTVINSTFSGNGAPTGGAIFNNGTFHLKNTILANSTSGADCHNSGSDTITTNINNLIETNGASGNMCDTPMLTVDPNLGTLTDSPAYFPINTDSPASNTGDDATCAAAPVSNTSQNGVSRTQGAHCDIGAFENLVIFTLTLKSVNTNDGWILESTETSGNGGTLNSATTTFNLGDDAANKQYRAILHFDTSALPDNAVITSATLKIKKQGVMGTDPFTLLGDLKASVRKPAFGAATLALSDFKSAPGKNNVATFSNTPVSNWYSALVNNTGRVYINRLGTTQFRLAFTTDDNNDNGVDLMKFYSGNAGAAARPQLIIQYYVP
jgi:CSLREA domain-containing protein